MTWKDICMYLQFAPNNLLFKLLIRGTNFGERKNSHKPQGDHQYNDQERVFANVRNTIFPVPNSFKYQVKPEFMTQLYITGTKDNAMIETIKR